MSEQKSETPVNVRVENDSDISLALAVIGWLGGIALAKGGFALLAVVFPPYGWYLVVERMMQVAGLLQ